jgi:membrane protease YdiL (CAAX protease family)
VFLWIAGVLAMVELAGRAAAGSSSPEVHGALTLLATLAVVQTWRARVLTRGQRRSLWANGALHALCGLVTWGGLALALELRMPVGLPAAALTIYLPAFAEEVLFRGTLLPGIILQLRQRLGLSHYTVATVGAALAALTFAGAHLPAEQLITWDAPPRLVLHLTAVGGLLTIVYVVGGPWMAYALHAAFNTRIDAGVSPAMGGGASGVLMSLIIIVLIARAVRTGADWIARAGEAPAGGPPPAPAQSTPQRG